MTPKLLLLGSLAVGCSPKSSVVLHEAAAPAPPEPTEGDAPVEIVAEIEIPEGMADPLDAAPSPPVAVEDALPPGEEPVPAPVPDRGPERAAATAEDAPDRPDYDAVAGPRNVVVQDVPDQRADLPGRGALVAYMGGVRSNVMVTFRACMLATDVTAADGPALVNARVSSDGTVLSLDLSQESGSGGLDTCALQAFTDTALPAPPAEILDADGALDTPDMAFLHGPR